MSFCRGDDDSLFLKFTASYVCFGYEIDFAPAFCFLGAPVGGPGPLFTVAISVTNRAGQKCGLAYVAVATMVSGTNICPWPSSRSYLLSRG